MKKLIFMLFISPLFFSCSSENGGSSNSVKHINLNVTPPANVEVVFQKYMDNNWIGKSLEEFNKTYGKWDFQAGTDENSYFYQYLIKHEMDGSSVYTDVRITVDPERKIIGYQTSDTHNEDLRESIESLNGE